MEPLENTESGAPVAKKVRIDLDHSLPGRLDKSGQLAIVAVVATDQIEPGNPGQRGPTRRGRFGLIPGVEDDPDAGSHMGLRILVPLQLFPITATCRHWRGDSIDLTGQ